MAEAKPSEPHDRLTPTVLERVLARSEPQPASPTPQTASPGSDPGGDLREAVVASWDNQGGVLSDGVSARLGPSCLLRPQAGDRVLVWRAGMVRTVLAVLERPEGETTAILATPGPLSIQAPEVALASRSVQIRCEDLLTHAKNRHSVEDTRTDTARVRVAQVGIDVRRATTSSDEVSGTMVQRIGTWLSTTARDARLKARTFLFD